MKLIHKKILFIILLCIVSMMLIFLYTKSNDIKNNVVIVKKVGKLIKYNENPNGVFGLKTSPNIISNGFFINKNTIVTTAHSVGDKNDRYKIQTMHGKKIKANLIYKNEKNDIAKLQIQENYTSPANVQTTDNIKIGEQISCMFYDTKTQKLKTKLGKILNIKNNHIITDIVFTKGQSGGIVINKKKQIIGMIHSYNLQDKTGIIKIIQL